MTWQDALLAHFTPKRQPMLLAVDPDNLLRDERLLAEIQNRNYDVLELEDEVGFRHLFERSYRSRWDAGEPRHVVVIVHTTQAEGYIPYDLWQKSKRLELSVGQMFPNLNAIVLRKLDRAYYPELYPAHQALLVQGEMRRGERQTIEFLLRAVFDLDPLAAGRPERWVEFLIYKHYRARQMPPALEDYLRQHLLPGVAACGLQEAFLDNAPAFYHWLEGCWADFASSLIQPGSAPNPQIDFSDLHLRPLLSTLFSQGLLGRLDAPAEALPAGWEWAAVGLKSAAPGLQVSEAQFARAVYTLSARLQRLADMDATEAPGGKTDLRDWLDLAAGWAEAIYQANSLPAGWYEKVQPHLAAARQALDGRFSNFVQARYSAVSHYQDNKGPLSLAGVNPWLYQRCAAQERIALVCLDGLALDQWYLLRDFLAQRLPGLTCDENRTYAVAPTLTPVSRQALFAGLPPAAFADTLHRTDQDERRWLAYWVNHDIPAKRVAYQRLDEKDAAFTALRPVLESKNLRLGLLVSLFDEVMHETSGMPPAADKRVYYATLRSRLEHGALSRLFDLLLAHDYRVFITSDHGNIAGVGNGLKPPKALVDGYARRVALFDQPALAQEYAAANGLLALHTKTLPPDLRPVYPPGQALFAAVGATHISHGGLSLEELVVPFVELRRGKAAPEDPAAAVGTPHP